MAVDKAAVWPASVLTALSAFKEQQFPFFFSFCGEVDRFCSVLHLVSSSPQVSFDSCGSECSDYSSSTRPWPRANVLLSTVPVKLWETGRSGRAAALNIYILRGSRGVQAKTRLIKHFQIENTWLFTSRKVITAHFMALSKKTVTELSQQASYLHFRRETLCQSSFTLLAHHKAEADTYCFIHTHGNRTKDNNQIITTYFTVNKSPQKQTQQWADPNKKCCLCSHSLM